MSLSGLQADALQPLTRDRFAKIRDHELRPGFTRDGLRVLHEKAGKERILRDLHRTRVQWGRAPFELLQNADDASARTVTFILHRNGLGFAHDGRWFTTQNFRGLAEGWSDKDPSQCIGHKGLGFRSVLDITPSPHLYWIGSQDSFGVKFSWAVNKGHIDQTLQQHPELRSLVDDWTRYGHAACPIMAIPNFVKKDSPGAAYSLVQDCGRGTYGKGLTTLFWLPAHDPELPPSVLRDLAPRGIVADDSGRQLLMTFLRGEVAVLLPFLESIQSVSVFDGTRHMGTARRSVQGSLRDGADVAVSVRAADHEEEVRSVFLIARTFPIPAEVKTHQDAPKALKAMREAKVAVAVSVDAAPRHVTDSCFHVYFPTEERTGTGFTVHGDFYVRPDRTQLMPGHYNSWLLERAAALCTHEFLDSLLRRYKNNTRSVYEALAPDARHATGRGGEFVELVGKALRGRKTPFVATPDGLSSPAQVALPALPDASGFWHAHFSEALASVLPGKHAFLAPTADSQLARSFLRLAGIAPLASTTFVDLMEATGAAISRAAWWYECYTYLANDTELTLRPREFFAGRRLLLTDRGPLPGPTGDRELIVCLPPSGDPQLSSVPEVFSSACLLVDRRLAELLRGSDSTESWVLNRFNVSRFEATDFVPRAIRRAAPQVLTGAIEVTLAQLTSAWDFMRRIVAESRDIESSDFWREVGRFPLPTEAVDPMLPITASALTPAFLCYWPRPAPRLCSSQEVSIGLGARSRVHCSNSVGDTLPREL